MTKIPPKKGTTVRFDKFDHDLIATAAAAKGMSLPEYIARAARAAALAEQLAADRGDGLEGYYEAVDHSRVELWHEAD